MDTNQSSTPTLAMTIVFHSGSFGMGNRLPKFSQLGKPGHLQIAISQYFKRKLPSVRVVQLMSFAPCFMLYHGTAGFMAFLIMTTSIGWLISHQNIGLRIYMKPSC